MLAKKEKRIKREMYQNIFFAVMIGIFFIGSIGFLLISNLKINQKRANLIEQIKTLEEEMQLLENKNKGLEIGIIQTETETYWEEKIREQGYKKPGEEAVVVLPPEGESQELPLEERGFWQKFLEKLGF